MITHINKKNKPIIVDISSKKETKRFAKAIGTVQFSKTTFNQIKSLTTKKGNIVNTAIIAGIIGSKKTSELIPLCHNINIESVSIDVKKNNNKNSLTITCNVKVFSKTGAEMEALVGVSTACLTIYDMCKSLDKKIYIKDIKLIQKIGGKSDINIS